jgi:hypothetical protein
MSKDDRLKTIVREWSSCAAPAEVTALADAARQRHDGVSAVLFYGSCMRSNRFDEGIVDLYLLVDDYRRAFGSRLQALLNRLLPPNVFYLEVPYGGKTVRAKYAVLTLDDFDRGAREWFHSYVWGRFAQPCGLVYSRTPGDGERIQESLAWAVRTFMRWALPQAPETFTIRELWSTGLSLSYRCELRSEDHAKTVRLFDATPAYYEAVTPAAMEACGLRAELMDGDGPTRYRLRFSPGERKRNLMAWRLRQAQGKALSALRLLKALLTFENGVEYILWKIERHSGVRVDPSPSLRRFPLLALCVTFWRLFRRGAFR